MSQNQRNSLLINRSFQISLIIKFVILNFAIMTIFGVLMYLFLNSEVESNLRSAHVTFNNLNEMLFPIILALSIINILFSSIIVAVFILVASHRIAGPQFRFLQILKDIENRDLTTTRDIRDDDQFQKSSEALNQAVSIIRTDLTELKNTFEKINNSSSDNFTGNQKEAVDKINEVLNRYSL